jgi:hypothetical protein
MEFRIVMHFFISSPSSTVFVGPLLFFLDDDIVALLRCVLPFECLVR